MGLPAMALFGQTHILHDCATTAHELPASSSHLVQWCILLASRDNLHTRPNRNIIKQIFDIVIAQTNTALTYPKSNTKIGIGTVGVALEPADVDAHILTMGLSGPAGTNAGKLSLVSHIRAECSALASRLELLVYVQR